MRAVHRFSTSDMHSTFTRAKRSTACAECRPLCISILYWFTSKQDFFSTINGVSPLLQSPAVPLRKQERPRARIVLFTIIATDNKWKVDNKPSHLISIHQRYVRQRTCCIPLALSSLSKWRVMELLSRSFINKPCFLCSRAPSSLHFPRYYKHFLLI